MPPGACHRIAALCDAHFDPVDFADDGALVDDAYPNAYGMRADTDRWDAADAVEPWGGLRSCTRTAARRADAMRTVPLARAVRDARDRFEADGRVDAAKTAEARRAYGQAIVAHCTVTWPSLADRYLNVAKELHYRDLTGWTMFDAFAEWAAAFEADGAAERRAARRAGDNFLVQLRAAGNDAGRAAEVRRRREEATERAGAEVRALLEYHEARARAVLMAELDAYTHSVVASRSQDLCQLPDVVQDTLG